MGGSQLPRLGQGRWRSPTSKGATLNGSLVLLREGVIFEIGPSVVLCWTQSYIPYIFGENLRVTSRFRR